MIPTPCQVMLIQKCSCDRNALIIYKLCDTPLGTMDLRLARVAKGLSQVQAAARLRVSQPYLAMLETGSRPLTRQLARRVMKVYDLPATVLPLSELGSLQARSGTEGLARDLAALGYPGFAHLRPRHWTPKNPSEVLLTALAQDHLEARLVGAALARAEILAA
jgi:transcriptional regulator with XRE-family HTH domain